MAWMVSRGSVFCGLLVPLVSLVLGACSKMDPKECGKLRESAYDLINSPSACDKDSDCKASDWPGCPKAINGANFEKIRLMHESAAKGKCEEKKTECKPAPPLYCQEGLCAFKYKNAVDQLRIEP